MKDGGFCDKCCCGCFRPFLEGFFFFIVTIIVAERISITSDQSRFDFTSFPTACSDWAVDGCTRITLKKEGVDQGCLRPEDIPDTLEINFKWMNNLDEIINTCMTDKVPGSKQQSQSYVATEQSFTSYYSHYTVLTPTFGFMDDFYISV